VRELLKKIDLIYPLIIDPINDRIDYWHANWFSVRSNLLKNLTFADDNFSYTLKGLK
jgi:hypothetical protein